MADENIYLADWIKEGAEALNYLLAYYHPLQQFFRQAAGDKLAVIIAIG